jgi:putative hydrolase of HD superfamily
MVKKKTKNKDLAKIKKLTSFFFEIGTLRKIVRSHRQTLLTDDLSDNIASHSFRVAIIGYFLAKEVGADSDKVIKMCLLHDIEESRAGDQNWVHKRYIKVFEDEIRREQLEKVPNSQELLNLSKEYDEKKSLEAKAAKDADLLDQVLLLREYEWGGNKEAKRWLDGGAQRKRMYNQITRQIVKEISKQKPSLWWHNLWTSNRR